VIKQESEACVEDNVDEELAATFAAHDEETATFTNHDEETDAKNYVNVELAEKYQIVKNVKTTQNAKSKFAINMWVNILEIIKNNRAKSKKITVEVYMVGAKTEEFNVEQHEADATALAGPQNTKNDVEVDVAKKTQVEKAAKTTSTTNTEALRIKTTNKFEKQSC
jgi:hypothetical protein